MSVCNASVLLLTIYFVITLNRRKHFPESQIINPLLAKMGLMLASFLFVCRDGIKKKYLAYIQPSWPHTWSVIHTYSRTVIGSDFIKTYMYWLQDRRIDGAINIFARQWHTRLTARVPHFDTHGNVGFCLLKIVLWNFSSEQILTVTIRPSPAKIFRILIQKSLQDLCFTSLYSTLNFGTFWENDLFVFSTQSDLIYFILFRVF